MFRTLNRTAVVPLACFVVLLLTAGAVAFATSASATGNDDDSHKVEICHVPQGNPGNAHTILVDEHAVPAHLKHGDTLGPCPWKPDPTDDPTETPTEEPTEEPTETPTETPTDTPTDEPTQTPTDPEPSVPTDAPPTLEPCDDNARTDCTPQDTPQGPTSSDPPATEPVCVGDALTWSDEDARGNTTHHTVNGHPDCVEDRAAAPQEGM